MWKRNLKVIAFFYKIGEKTKYVLHRTYIHVSCIHMWGSPRGRTLTNWKSHLRDPLPIHSTEPDCSRIGELSSFYDAPIVAAYSDSPAGLFNAFDIQQQDPKQTETGAPMQNRVLVAGCQRTILETLFQFPPLVFIEGSPHGLEQLEQGLIRPRCPGFHLADPVEIPRVVLFQAGVSGWPDRSGTDLVPVKSPPTAGPELNLFGHKVLIRSGGLAVNIRVSRHFPVVSWTQIRYH
jgi:hypothetical protein